MTAFTDLDFGNLLGILEEHGVDLPGAYDYNVLSVDEAENKATFEILLEEGLTWSFMFAMRRSGDVFFPVVN